MKSFDKKPEDVEEYEESKSLLIHQISLQNRKQNINETQIQQNFKSNENRQSVQLYEKFQELKKINHNTLCRYLDMREQKQLQNHYLIFQEAYDCSIQDLAFRYSQNSQGFTEQQLIQMAYSILKSIIYLQQKYNIEIGFFTPNQIYYSNDIQGYKLNNFGQFYLDAFNTLPEKLEDIIFRPPEYYILGGERAKHGQFSQGKGEIWSLGLLLRYCMVYNESLTKESDEDIMSSYFVLNNTKLDIQQEEIQNSQQSSRYQNTKNKITKSNDRLDNSQGDEYNMNQDGYQDEDGIEDNQQDQQQQQYRIDKTKLISDILAISQDERYHSQSAFLKTPYQMPYLNQFQVYLNGCKGVGKHFSYQLRDFISKCICVNPSLRLTALELIHHPIFKQIQINEINYNNNDKLIEESQFRNNKVGQSSENNSKDQNKSNSGFSYDKSREQEEKDNNNNNNDKDQDQEDIYSQTNEDSELDENDEDNDEISKNNLEDNIVNNEDTQSNEINNNDDEDEEENQYKETYELIKNEPKKKRMRLNKAYEEVIKKGNLNLVEELFSLEIVIDIIYNEIESNILSHATIIKNSKKDMFKPFYLISAIKSQSNITSSSSPTLINQSNIIKESDNSYYLRIDCKPIYQHIVNEIAYYTNVLKNVKELQTIIDYMGLNQSTNNPQSNSFRNAAEKSRIARNALLNINTTIQLEQSQFLNQTLLLNESTIYQNYDNQNNIGNNNYQPINLNLSTILNDPDLSMCIPQSQSANHHKQYNKQLQNGQANHIQQQQQQQIIDQSFFNNDEINNTQTTSSSNNNNNSNANTNNLNKQLSLNNTKNTKDSSSNPQSQQTQQTQQQQIQSQQQQDLDKSSTSISFGFFKKMKISEKVSKLWGSNKNDGQQQNTQNSNQQNGQNNENNSQSQQNNNQTQSNNTKQGNTTNQQQSSSTQNINQQPNNNLNNDLFANTSLDNDGEFQPFPTNMIMPNNSISQKIKEYLFYMNLFCEDRRIISPKQIPQYLIQVELPIYLRSELYKKVIVLPQKSYELFKFLTSIPLMYKEKQNDLKQIENDLPRCHQYTNYCASLKGQKSIQQTLYGLLNLNVNYYYIQGMDAMAFVALQATPNNSKSTALLILQDLVKKSLFMHLSSQQTPEDYIMKEKILIYKWLLRLEDPQLSDYLEEKQFYPEIYTISWFLNIFSMVFDIQTVLKIWDFIICDSNFSLCFAVSLMIELKDYLMMKDSNELMSSIRNLEGVNNTKNCWRYAQYLMKTLPETFLTLNYIQNENEKNDYQKEFFIDCPWEIPPVYQILSKRPIFYASIFDLLKQKHVVYIDIRTKEEYETACVKNSLYAHFINGRINEIVLSYLEKKSNKFSSFENLEDCQNNDFMSLIVIVFNYEKQQEMLDAVQQLLSVGVRRLVVLNGGIQSIQKDRPDLLDFKHRIIPINYYKRKQQ